MTKEFDHTNCEHYIKEIDGCILYFELGAKNVSQYNQCYEKMIWGEEDGN